MRTLLPSATVRRRVVAGLNDFFYGYQDPDFDQSILLLTEFYQIKKPQVEWCNQIARGHRWGETCPDGLIRLIHPAVWRSDNLSPTSAQWIRVLFHEFYHYLHWVDDERKADGFAYKFVRGLRA